MANATYYPVFSNEATFQALFNEIRVLYRGVVKVWIGENTQDYPGNIGYLYAEYTDGSQQELGLVSEFPYAKSILDPLRPTPLTQEEWYQLLASIPSLAQQVEDDAEHTTEYTNYAWGWANNKDGTVQNYSATNNSKYWAQESKKFANGKDLTDQMVNPTDNAEYYRDQAKLWANNGTDGDSPSASNNAKTYAANAEESNKQAESWTKGTRSGQTDTVRQNAATDNAKYYSEQAHESKQQAESWTVGTRDGSTDTVRPNASTNNAKYYSDNADTSARNAEENNLQAESWAVGTRNGSTDTQRQEAATNNAKAYATQAGSSAAAASQSERNALQYTQDAENFKDTALESKDIAVSAQAAAEEAQAKAELAMSHYPRINSNDNWETWDVDDNSWSDTGHKSIAEATIEYAYQNSTSGTVPPTGTWTTEPQPQNARFLWMRMKYTWTNGRIDYFYNVSYIGANGTGSVNSVNGLGGDVILDGTNIYVDDNAQTRETIYGAITRIGTAITNSEIDALF